MTTTDRGRREKHYSKTLPPEKASTRWDAVVIGSGMGGLSAAALLAQLGLKVLIVEQHYVPGGFTHTFRRKGYTWDVGVHAVGEVTQHSFPGRLLSKLSGGRLKWAPLGEVYDEFYFPDGMRLDYPNHPKKFRDNLVAAFPSEAAAIDAYLAESKKIAKSKGAYFLTKLLPVSVAGLASQLLARPATEALFKRTREVIDSLTSNPKLKTVLASQWGYYGSVPSRSAWAIQALVVNHFQYGGYYPEGGSAEIANTLLKTVADAGGWTLCSNSVEEILIEDDKAVGVRLDSGDVHRAPRIISAAGVMATVRRMLPPAVREQPWARSIDGLSPASAHVCLYLGFKGDIRQAGASAANKWFYETWDTEEDAWRIDREDQGIEAPILYCSFPSLKDPRHDPGPETRHTGEVVTFVPWHVFKPWVETRWRKRGADYDALKTQLQERLLRQFFRHMPGLEPMLDHAELSTPLSTDWFCRPIEGSIYGIEPTPERFQNPWLKPQSPIPQLYFAGSEVSTVGVMGAMIGGVVAAVAAEPLRALPYLWSAL